jgi:RNA polymerase sigma-70 factor (sigma-E family)
VRLSTEDGSEMSNPTISVAWRRQQFEILVEEIGKGLIQAAFLLCRDRDRANDLVAEALANAWPRWRDGQIADLRPYLRRAVVNLTYKSQRHRLVVRGYEAQFDSMMPNEYSTDAVAGRVDLVRALLRLPLPQRAVLTLRYFEDMAEAEVAETLGISVGTVKSRAARGLATLRSSQGRLADA